MKINPPKIIIDENAPFKEALFGREEFAKSLTNLIQNVSESLVVFVNAPWGAGKTTFSEMWQAYCLMSDTELATAKNEAELSRKGDHFSDMSMWVRGNRNQAIPALCGQMDRFSLLPRSK